MKNNHLAVVIPAAGVGSRMGYHKPKQYIEILGQTILQHTIQKFESMPQCQSIILVVSAKDPYIDEYRDQFSDKVKVVIGGAERADSVLAGLRNIDSALFPWVLVHDAARPCIQIEDVNRLIQQCAEKECGGILATPVKDTIKRSDGGSQIDHTIDRRCLWRAQTPQLFLTEKLASALSELITDSNHSITDEASAMEVMGYMVELVEGSDSNIKVTTPEDIALAEYYLKKEKNICV